MTEFEPTPEKGQRLTKIPAASFLLGNDIFINSESLSKVRPTDTLTVYDDQGLIDTIPGENASNLLRTEGVCIIVLRDLIDLPEGVARNNGA